MLQALLEEKAFHSERRKQDFRNPLNISEPCYFFYQVPFKAQEFFSWPPLLLGVFLLRGGCVCGGVCVCVFGFGFCFLFGRHSSFTSSTPNPRQITIQNTLCVCKYISLLFCNKGCKLSSALSRWLSAQKEEFPLQGVHVKVNLSQGKARVDFSRSSNIYFLNHASVSEALWKRHCSHFRVSQPSGYNGKKEYTTTWKRLQAPTPKDNTEYIYTTLSSLRSPTACLVFCFTLLPQREMNCSKPRKTGHVRTPNDIQILSTLASSQTSHLTAKWEGVGENIPNYN